MIAGASSPVLVCALLAATAAASYGCRSRLSHVKHVIRNAGSDTMVNLAQAWAEAYAGVNPAESVEVSGGGSATGITALIAGTADLANCSRKMEPSEVDAARRRTGGTPREHIAGYDALAVFVHPSNPLNEISLEELAEVFGRDGSVHRWPDMGVTIPGVARQEILLISRQSNSGTYEYFRHAILDGKGGDFRAGTRDLNGSKEVITLVGNTRAAIGYGGMGYASPAVKMLRVSRRKGEPAYLPAVETALAGTYPIARPLFVYSAATASAPVQRYLDWILSPAGQKIVIEAGYVPPSTRAQASSRSEP